MDQFEQSEEALFEKCLELPREEREAFLENACRHNLTLKENVLTLLRFHDTPKGFLEVSSEEPVSFEPDAYTTEEPADDSPQLPDKPRHRVYLTLSAALLAVFSVVVFFIRSDSDSLHSPEYLNPNSIAVLRPRNDLPEVPAEAKPQPICDGTGLR